MAFEKLAGEGVHELESDIVPELFQQGAELRREADHRVTSGWIARLRGHRRRGLIMLMQVWR